MAVAGTQPSNLSLNYVLRIIVNASITQDPQKTRRQSTETSLSSLMEKVGKSVQKSNL